MTGSIPQFMFEPIEPRMTPLERLCAWWMYENSPRKEETAKLKAARAKTKAAFIALDKAKGKRDGTATIKRHKLRDCVTEQLRAENQCKGANYG